MSLWALGGTVIIYLAALNNVPQDLYEAAAIDGASPWQQFRHVTLPRSAGRCSSRSSSRRSRRSRLSMRHTPRSLNRATAAFSSDAALFYVIYLFQQAFQFFHMGYASALAWLLFVIIMIITAIQVRLSNRFVYYEGRPDEPDRTRRDAAACRGEPERLLRPPRSVRADRSPMSCGSSRCSLPR